jgi:hypothetical protein
VSAERDRVMRQYAGVVVIDHPEIPNSFYCYDHRNPADLSAFQLSLYRSFNPNGNTHAGVELQLNQIGIAVVYPPR